MKLSAAPLLLALAPAASAQFVTIAEEDFDSYAPGFLGNLNGGTGWANAWYSGMGMGDAVVAAPGFNTTANLMQTVVNNGGSFRFPDAGAFPDIAPNLLFGADGTTIWIRFDIQRIAGGADQYGGFSLVEQFVGEKLFIGAPWQTPEWGFDVPGGTGPVSVPGTNIDAMTRIVVRIDYQPGMERFRMWVDPGSDNPITAADLDQPIEDHVWNEIRIQSGEPLIGAAGYLFDSLVIQTLAPDAGTDICNGDGGNQMGCTSCPCGNNATIGTVGGCLNSAGTSTRLLSSGSASIAMADLRFEASGAPPANSAVLTSGNALAPANMANPCFGLNSGVQSVSLDGLRCAVQGVLRHGVRPSDANGDIGVTTNGWGTPNGFFNFDAFLPGSTKHFQIIHRDDAMAICLTGQNTSQAITVVFTM